MSSDANTTAKVFILLSSIGAGSVLDHGVIIPDMGGGRNLSQQMPTIVQRRAVWQNPIRTGLRPNEESPADMTPEEIQALQEENERLKTAAQQSADSVARLEAKVNELLGETRTAKEAKRAAEAERQRIADEAARNTGDVQHLEASWQEKLAKRESELTGEISTLSSELDRMTVGREALRISTELDHNGSGKLLMPLITPRLKREVRDGKHVVVVLDKDGKPSASSVEDLIKEFRTNPELAPFVKGSNANGGGATGGGGGAPVGKTKLSDYSDAERIELYQTNPARFKELQAQEQRK